MPEIALSRKSLDEIVPVPGVQEYLLEHWITQEDKDRCFKDHGEAGCYFDGTYDWYAGFSQFVEPKDILEIGFYRGYSAAAMCKGFTPTDFCLVDDCREMLRGELIKSVRKLESEYRFNIYFYRVDTQTDTWKMITRLPFNLIHIDAFHTFDGCYNDLDHFAPLLTDHGLVVVHDTKTNEGVKLAVATYLSNHHGEWEHREIDNADGNIVMRRKWPTLAEGI